MDSFVNVFISFKHEYFLMISSVIDFLHILVVETDCSLTLILVIFELHYGLPYDQYCKCVFAWGLKKLFLHFFAIIYIVHLAKFPKHV
jgi:hypothetical protein